ncbi:DUF362 domain-containing protein [Desulfopila sp. IMCC35008]|uniref:DUF362 domain-containing protein n=1 Tax=Desulfopila sp. IMCC35008 TaxID=2653858 RepID=UPI0013D54529|nr:DUF362 domain-containing protein [Desulfopila sp. IMCC35008]
MLENDHNRPVYLYPCRDYSSQQLDPAIDLLIKGILGNYNYRGCTVLLKPNLISSRGPALACTSREFIAGVARWFLEHGCHVKLGDSPAFGSVRSVLERHGIHETLKPLDVEIVSFKTVITRDLVSGASVEIAAEAMECDFLVNLPRLKAHNQVYLTCAVKNYFGTVVGMRKAMMHMRHGSDHSEFSDILVRIPDLFPSSITIMDAVEVMHRSGPLDGDPLRLQVVGASQCPIALDTAVLRMLGLASDDSPLWRAARDMNHPGCFLDNIVYPARNPDEVGEGRFIPPDTLNPIRFNPLRLLSGLMRRLSLAFHS